MAKYASGKKSQAISDRSGLKVPYTDLKTTWDGLRVSPEDWEPKQPQLTPAKNVVDATALFNPRPDTDPENVDIFIGYNFDPFIDPRQRPGVGVSAPGFIGRCQFEVNVTSVTGVNGDGNIGVPQATIQTEVLPSGQAGDGEVGSLVREIEVTGVQGLGGSAEVGVEALDISINETGVGGSGDVGDVFHFLQVNPIGIDGIGDVGAIDLINQAFVTGSGGNGAVGVATVEDPFGWGIGPWGLGPWGDTEGRPHPIGQAGAGEVSSVTIAIETSWGQGGYGENTWQ